MQLSKITPGKYYQTQQGDGKVLHVTKTKVKIELPTGVAWLSAKEVQHEIVKPDEESDDDQPEEVRKNRLHEQYETIKGNSDEARIDLAESSVKPGDPLPLLKAAFHALRSYQYHNGSPALAEEVADAIERYLTPPDALLAKVGGKTP